MSERILGTSEDEAASSESKQEDLTFQELVATADREYQDLAKKFQDTGWSPFQDAVWNVSKPGTMLTISIMGPSLPDGMRKSVYSLSRPNSPTTFMKEGNVPLPPGAEGTRTVYRRLEEAKDGSLWEIVKD